MGKWRPPELPDGPLRDLNDKLFEVHARSGLRSSYQVSRWLKARHEESPEEWVPASHTTVHKTLVSPELPNAATMRCVVEAFIALGKIRHGHEILVEVDRLWDAAYEHHRASTATAGPILALLGSDAHADAVTVSSLPAAPPAGDPMPSEPSTPDTSTDGRRTEDTETSPAPHDAYEQLAPADQEVSESAMDDHPQQERALDVSEPVSGDVIPPAVSGLFGPNSALPGPDGARPDSSFTVKASVSRLAYTHESWPAFDALVPDIWYRTPEDAQQAGFRPRHTDPAQQHEQSLPQQDLADDTALPFDDGLDGTDDWTHFVRTVRAAHAANIKKSRALSSHPPDTAALPAIDHHSGILASPAAGPTVMPQKTVAQLLAEHRATPMASLRRQARTLATRATSMSLPADWVRECSDRAQRALGRTLKLTAEKRTADAERAFEDAIIDGDPRDAAKGLQALWENTRQNKQLPADSRIGNRLARRGYWLLSTNHNNSQDQSAAARHLLAKAITHGSQAAPLILRRLDAGDTLPYQAKLAEPPATPATSEVVGT